MSISKKLTAWFQENKRDLPWRKSQDPYRILVSEIMLQQTTVAAVIPYYQRFLSEFPKVEDLANSSVDRVYSFWSGLGYYSRARNLHKAAGQIVARGEFPKQYDEILELSGVGPYTAAAVSSIAFGVPVAAVDGNVIRVISRLFDISRDVGIQKTKTEIINLAQSILGKDAGDHNQAMMELGATICTPKNPMCLLCPLAKECKALKNRTVLKRPMKAKKRSTEPWIWNLYWMERNGKVAICRGENGTPWLKDTWVLPGHAEKWSGKKDPDHDFKHAITHHRIFAKVIRAAPKKDLRNLKWVLTQNLRDHGVSSIVSKATKFVKGD